MKNLSVLLLSLAMFFCLYSLTEEGWGTLGIGWALIAVYHTIQTMEYKNDRRLKTYHIVAGTLMGAGAILMLLASHV